MGVGVVERILVFGAGAVGQFVGAVLARAGHDVTLLARPPLASALATGPLVVRGSADGQYAVPLATVTALDQLPAPPTLVILTVKSYDTVGALTDLARLVGEGATVLTLQNGVGNEEALVAALGAGAVRSGAFTISVSVARPGEVLRHTARGGFGLAPIHGESLGRELAVLRSTGLPVTLARSHRALKWSKLLLNMLANAQCAILDLLPRAIFASPTTFAVERAAFHEARAVMRAVSAGVVDLPAYPVRLLVGAMGLPPPLARRILEKRVARGRGDKLPSLALDLRAGRGRSEVAWLNGAVAREGARVGIATPVNGALVGLLDEATLDTNGAAKFAGQPEVLAAAIRRARGGR